MAIWKQPIDLDAIMQRGKGTLSDHLNIRFTDFTDNSLVAVMPVIAQVHQPIGIMHGGASCVLAETVGSVAAQFCVDMSRYYCVGLDINTSHLRAVRAGDVTATATPHHLGRSTQVWQIQTVDEAMRTIAVTRLTMAVLEKQKA